LKKIFYEHSTLKKGDLIYIEDKDFHHLSNVLRVKKGDSFVIGDLENNEFIGVIENINKNQIVFSLKDYHYREEIKYPEITLFFSILKGDKNEDVIQKCTELGVSNFVPVITKNSIVKVDEDSASKKVQKWNVIARESSMQCGGKKIPKIQPILKFEDISTYGDTKLKIFGLIEKNKKTLLSVLKDYSDIDKIFLFVGPEGDFSHDEIEHLKKNNWIGTKFVSNVLKSDTASIFLCSSILFYYGRAI